MNTEFGLERCLAFINCQLHPANAVVGPAQSKKRWRAVTISRQTGSGGHAVAEALAKFLQACPGEKGCPWTVFDRNLVERVLEDHHLPKHLARFMPEDRVLGIDDALEELFGLHPPSQTLVRQTAETVLQLAELGNVIIIGRGANVITSRLDYVFHVRLVGSLENRAAGIQKSRLVGRAAALQIIRREDRGRARFLKKYFGQNIDDLLLYHLILNTDRLSYEEAGRIIGDAMINGRQIESGTTTRQAIGPATAAATQKAATG